MDAHLLMHDIEADMKYAAELMKVAPKKGCSYAMTTKSNKCNAAHQVLDDLAANGLITQEQYHNLLKRLDMSMKVVLMPLLPPDLMVPCMELHHLTMKKAFAKVGLIYKPFHIKMLKD